MKGHLDRIEDHQLAVILVEEVGKEFVIPLAELPEGSAVNSYFDLTIENGEITSITLDEEFTALEKQKTEDLMAKLRSKSRGSKLKRK